MNHTLYIGILIVLFAAGALLIWQGDRSEHVIFTGIGMLTMVASIILIFIGIGQGNAVRDTPVAIYQVDRTEPDAAAHQLHAVILFERSPTVVTIDCDSSFDVQFCKAVKPGDRLNAHDEFDFSGFGMQRTFSRQ